MKSHHRPFVYESSDFKRMCALVVQDNAGKKESFVWHIARLVDWKYNLFNFKRCFPGNYACAGYLVHPPGIVRRKWEYDAILPSS